MRNLWSNLKPNHYMNFRDQEEDLRERTDDKKKGKTEDISCERGVEIQLRAAAQRSYPEDATDPFVAPPDYDIRQSGRVLEIQNSDLWLQPSPGTFQSSWPFVRKRPRTVVQEHPKMEGQGGQDGRGQEADDQEKR